MKAVQFSKYGGPEVLRVVEVKNPMPVRLKCGSPCGRRG